MPPLPVAPEPIPLDGPPLVPLVAAVEPPTPPSPGEALLQPQSATNGGRIQRRRVSDGFVMGWGYCRWYGRRSAVTHAPRIGASAHRFQVSPKQGHRRRLSGARTGGDEEMQ
jgi:hypothetical protein